MTGDRSQTRQGTLEYCFRDDSALLAQLDDVIDQDDSVENGNAEQGYEPHAGGDRAVPQRQAAEGLRTPRRAAARFTPLRRTDGGDVA